MILFYLCASSRTKLKKKKKKKKKIKKKKKKKKKLLKIVNELAKFNMLNFGINKCASMVIQPDTPPFQNK